jgi:hypothetical protein
MENLSEGSTEVSTSQPRRGSVQHGLLHAEDWKSMLKHITILTNEEDNCKRSYRCSSGPTTRPSPNMILLNLYEIGSHKHTLKLHTTYGADSHHHTSEGTAREAVAVCPDSLLPAG